MDSLFGVVILIVGAVVFSRLTRKKKVKKPVHMPIITHSENGYEGHLDFLEQHGFISRADRESQRNNDHGPH